MVDDDVRRLYAQVLLRDDAARFMIVKWLSAMSPEDSEDLLAEYATMLDPLDPALSTAWLVTVRADASLLRGQHFH